MKNFIVFDDKIINLARVSNIIFDSVKRKITFQFANSINILGKETSDFYEKEFENYPVKMSEILNHSYVKDNFIKPDYAKLGKFYEIVNINHINNITLDEPKKIIFNMDYGIDIFDKQSGEIKKISKFIYWHYNNENDKQKEINKLKELIRQK
jgi:hypothetical protein